MLNKDQKKILQIVKNDVDKVHKLLNYTNFSHTNLRNIKKQIQMTRKWHPILFDHEFSNNLINALNEVLYQANRVASGPSGTGFFDAPIRYNMAKHNFAVKVRNLSKNVAPKKTVASRKKKL